MLKISVSKLGPIIITNNVKLNTHTGKLKVALVQENESVCESESLYCSPIVYQISIFVDILSNIFG